MKEIKRESVLTCFENENELSEQDLSLLKSARKAIEGSYAPYSKFHVGCALLLENGEVIAGNNQENIAYPSGLCAERVAIFYAGATYPDVPVKAMAITVKAEEFEVNEPVMSCGACLQSMSEYELKFNKKMRIILQGETGSVYVANGLQTFMPYQFWMDGLRKN